MKCWSGENDERDFDPSRSKKHAFSSLALSVLM